VPALIFFPLFMMVIFVWFCFLVSLLCLINICGIVLGRGSLAPTTSFGEGVHSTSKVKRGVRGSRKVETLDYWIEVLNSWSVTCRIRSAELFQSLLDIRPTLGLCWNLLVILSCWNTQNVNTFQFYRHLAWGPQISWLLFNNSVQQISR
jgi:hypothetical protein